MGNRTRGMRKIDAARKVTDDLRKQYATTGPTEPLGEVKRQRKVAVAKVRKSRSGEQR